MSEKIGWGGGRNKIDKFFSPFSSCILLARVKELEKLHQMSENKFGVWRRVSRYNYFFVFLAIFPCLTFFAVLCYKELNTPSEGAVEGPSKYPYPVVYIFKRISMRENLVP